VHSGVQAYFSDPSQPWQRGTNENTNGLQLQDFCQGAGLRALRERALGTISGCTQRVASRDSRMGVDGVGVRRAGCNDGLTAGPCSLACQSRYHSAGSSTSTSFSGLTAQKGRPYLRVTSFSSSRRPRASAIAFARASRNADAGDARVLVFAANFSPVPRYGYRLGLPRGCRWREAINTDSAFYGGSDLGNLGGIDPEPVPWHDQPFSAEVTLPPLGAIWLVPE